MLRALAARPLTLTELDRLIAGLSYPSLERRPGAMRLAGQIKPCPSPERGTPYTVTPWLRRAIAPLAAAARWERVNVPDYTAPITKSDAEAAFLLAIPLLDSVDPEHSGACRDPRPDGARLAGVLISVEEGRVVSCATKHQALIEGLHGVLFGGEAAGSNRRRGRLSRPRLGTAVLVDSRG